MALDMAIIYLICHRKNSGKMKKTDKLQYRKIQCAKNTVKTVKMQLMLWEKYLQIMYLKGVICIIYKKPFVLLKTKPNNPIKK